MINEQVLTYIKSQLAAGVASDAITKALIAQGWLATDVAEAFASIVPKVNSIQPQSPLPPPPAVVMTQNPVSKPARFQISRIFSKSVLLAVFGIAFAGVIAGGLVYAYEQKIGPFGHIPYTQDNLLSGMLDSFGHINTSSYSLSGTLAVGPRDPDAVPFTVQQSNAVQIRQQYQNDATRVQDMTLLIRGLSMGKNYPATLQGAANTVSSLSSYYAQKVSLTDPATHTQYQYAITDGGKNFALSVTFETQDAIRTVQRSYLYAATTTPISGKTVTFTKDSPSYLYISAEPPKPFLVQYSDLMRLLPAEIDAMLSVAATTDWTKPDADWKFNADATANFGDLSLKIDADALKQSGDYYLRVNNIPSLLGETLASLKGEWIKIDSTAASSTASIYGFNEFQSIASELPSAEKNYKDHRAELTDFLTKLVGFADTEHLLSFKNAPRSEKVSGRLLYRYDLELNKAAILPFYQKMVDEANANKGTAYSGLFNDPGTIEYLQSDEFNQMFDYLNKNTTITLWVDPQGYPAIVEYDIRAVPPNTAVALTNKQVNLVFKLELSNINQPVDIVAPSGAKPVEDLIKQENQNLNNYSSDPTINLQNSLRVVRDQMLSKRNTVPPEKVSTIKDFPLGSCKVLDGSLFTQTVIDSIASASGGDASKAACSGKAGGFAFSVPLSTPGYSWCIDSTGTSEQIMGALSGTSCK